jgi:hypothetical protein
MYRSVFVALLLLAGGCTGLGIGAPAPEALKAFEKARTVGVISAVGHKFALQKIGVTVFGNELKEVAIESWGIDAAVASNVSAQLGRRFTVKRISYPKGAFASYESPAAFSDTGAELQGIVRKLAASQNCDIVIVVTRGGAPFGSTNQTVAGLGMVEHGGALFPDNVTLYAVTTIHVYDGRTFERLHWQRTGFEFGGALVGMGGTAINAPSRKLDRSWWPATPQAVSSDKLRATTRALVEQSVGATIPQVMGMAKQAKAN